MQAGISIVDLAQRIVENENRKQDLLVSTNRIAMTNAANLHIDERILTPTNTAHGQIAERLKIPRPYYNRMLQEAPELLASNVNHWFNKEPERRLVRTYQPLTNHDPGVARAFLSNKYKFRENYSVAEALLPVISDRHDLQVLSAELTETRMYLQLISHQLMGEVRVGEVVKGGIAIRNSEIGLGAFDVSLFVYVLSCTNGMIREHSMRSYHIGKRLDAEFGGNRKAFDTTVYSREAIAADTKAFQLKVRDLIGYAFDKDAFDKELVKFRQAADTRIPSGAVASTVEDITERFNMSTTEGRGVLERMIEGGDISKWGLANAVTNLANTVTDYDRAVELESVGGKIIDLSPHEWSSVTSARESRTRRQRLNS